MRCQAIEEMLSAYVNNELTPEQRESIENHLVGCADCREKLAGFQQVRDRMESLRTVPPAPDIKETVMSRIKSVNQSEKSFKIWGRRAFVLVPLAAVLAALLIVQPWSSFNGIQNTLTRVQAAMSGIQSYRVSVTGTSNEEGQTSESKIEVEYVAPDRYHYQRQQSWNNMNLDIIAIGNKQYIKGGNVNILELMSSTYPFSAMLTKDATLKYLDNLTDVQQLPEETIDGTPCWHYKGVYDFEKILRSQQDERTKIGLPPLSDQELAQQAEQMRSGAGSTTIELWIGKSDYLIRQMIMENQRPDNNGKLTSSTTTLKFFDFNQPITIDAPVDSSGKLLPGWTSFAPEQPAFSQDIQSHIDNNDPTNRMIKYNVNLTNISTGTLSRVDVRFSQSSDSGVWGSWSGGLSGPGPYNMQPGESLKYEITFGYDPASVKIDKVVQSIQNSSIIVGYITPDGQQKVETVHFEVPDSIYSLPTDLPPVHNLAPAGEYKVEETGATSAGPGVSGEINGKHYLFVPVGTQNADVYAPPGILILNIDNPTKPVKVAYLQSPENTRYLICSALSGNVLYASMNNFLWIIDVSHPESPRELARFSEVKPSFMVISGKYAYVNDGNQRISTLDIADPSHPQMIGNLTLTSLTGMMLDVSGNYLLAWTGDKTGDKLYTIDISSPESLKIVNSYAFSLPVQSPDTTSVPGKATAYVEGHAIEGNYAYLALISNEENAVAVLDISNPVNPHELAFLPLPDQQIQGPLFVSGDRVYLLTQPGYGIDRKTRIETIDISNPAKPVDLGFGILPDSWSFFTQVGNSSAQSYNMIDKYFYWFIGYELNQPVIEIFDLSNP